MTTDFFSLLNESNSFKNEETGEITLIVPKLESDKLLTINSNCKISSNCKTVISSPHLCVTSGSIFFKDITFETPLTIKKCPEFSMMNCDITNIKFDYSLSFEFCKNVELNQVNITNNEIDIAVFFQYSHAIANNLFIDGATKVIIALIKESSLNLCDSKLCNSMSKGINVLDSEFEIHNCTISDTIYPAIYVWNSKGKIMNNQINNIKMNGITINNADSIEIYKNNITDVNGSAISIINGSKCEVHSNTITKIGNNGIFVNNRSKINAHHNELSCFKYPAIAILTKSKAIINENKISDINSCGIRVINAKKIKIDKNEIKKIDECAISLLNTKNCIIKSNLISDCHIAAVEVYNQSKTSIFDNDLSRLGEFAFKAYALGQITAKNNTITDVGKSMVNLIYKGGGEFINNKLENCPQQKEGDTSSHYYFNGNGNFSGVTNDESKKKDDIQLEEKFIDNCNLCIKCKQRERKCFLLNCGHKIYCQECAEVALREHQKCPLCRLPIVDINKGFVTKNETCDICCDKKADCIVMPCCHIGYCHKCLNKWLQDNQRCPYCQAEPVSYSRIQDI